MTLTLAFAWAVVFAAGIVRGFAGFGFSALCVAGLSLFLPPAQVVPPVFMLEVLASVTLLRGALRDVDWRWLGWRSRAHTMGCQRTQTAVKVSLQSVASASSIALTSVAASSASMHSGGLILITLCSRPHRPTTMPRSNNAR